MSYIGTEPKDIRSFGRTKFDYTATQGQTAFTGADDDGKVLAFTVGQIEVYVNGILMDDSDFTTTGTGTVTLASAANLNDVVNVVSFETNIPDSNYVPASGGTFTGDVDFGANKITYANKYDNLADLPSASTYHGMFAHVHATGLAYYAHGGAWIPLANTTGATFSGNIVASDGINIGGTGAANKLDDYEEGTFTATVASGTVGTNTFYYTKVGRLVTVRGILSTWSDVSSSNIVDITNLPFSPATASQGQAVGTSMWSYLNTNHTTAYMTNGGAVRFYQDNTSGSYGPLTHSQLTGSTSTSVHVIFSYDAA